MGLGKAGALVQKREQRQFWIDLNVYFLKIYLERENSFWKIIFSSTQNFLFLIIFIKTFVICTFNAPILFFLHVLYNVISLNINNINTPKNKQNLPIHHHQTQWVNHTEKGVILKNLILPTTTFFQYGNTSKKKQAFSVWDFQKFRLTPILTHLRRTPPFRQL